MLTRTKIICTIGPSVNTEKKIKELVDAGMNVARINFSHGTHAEHLKTINILKKIREKSNRSLAIMLDTKGPEIRVEKVNNDSIDVLTKQKLELVEKFTGKENEVAVFPYSVFKNVDIGKKVLFNDGFVSTKIIKKQKNKVIVEVLNSGEIKTKKGVNIPDVDIDLPAMTDADMKDLKFGCLHDVDLVAASFIRSADHVLAIKKYLGKHKGEHILVIAKIENHQGINNFDSIVEVADGIMVARGDLGVEVDFSLVPKYQKMMIKKCYSAGKPVITATQMLESMMLNPRPTRAEASDVANAIYDSTSAVMLSGETAAGKYPIQTVRQMKKIVKEAEKDFDYKSFFYKSEDFEKFIDTSYSIAIAAVKTAYNLDAKAIFVYSSSGYTARLISRMRPNKPILALSASKRVYNQMSLNWGVIPVYKSKVKTSSDAFEILKDYCLKNDIVNFGDIVIVTAGVPFGRKGSTNLLRVENIGNILVRGFHGYGKKVSGKVNIVFSPDEGKQKSINGKILVVSRIDDNYIPMLKKAKGIILQNNIADHKSERLAISISKENDIPLLTRANNAMSLLSHEQMVTLDPDKKLVFKQIITKK
jgi:pyruvate kinase